MIILSQDKERIVNFDNITQIVIVERESWEVQVETDGDAMCLGSYQTEERAKEVLQEILKFRTNKLVMTTEGITSEIKDYFEMPEE